MVGRMTRHGLRPVLLALGAAVALGLLGRVLVHPMGGPPAAFGRAVLSLGAPWLVVAWAVGALSGTRRACAVAGGAALGLGTLGWYALSIAATDWGALPYARSVAPVWVLVAVAAGALLGLAGGSWHAGGRVARALAVALPAGALAGEALLLSGVWTERAARAALNVELALAGALLLAGVRRRAWWPLALAVTAFAAVAFAVGEGEVRQTLRATGWMGP
jgi:uncharacterized protein DUF6518